MVNNYQETIKHQSFPSLNQKRIYHPNHIKPSLRKIENCNRGLNKSLQWIQPINQYKETYDHHLSIDSYVVGAARAKTTQLLSNINVESDLDPLYPKEEQISSISQEGTKDKSEERKTIKVHSSTDSWVLHGRKTTITELTIQYPIFESDKIILCIPKIQNRTQLQSTFLRLSVCQGSEIKTSNYRHNP